MARYPYTITNGLGERLTFLRRVATTEGESLEVENLVKPGVGPPMHVHYLQEEALTVVQGQIGYLSKGQSPQYGGVGDTVVFPAGSAHRFWNAGSEDLRCVGYIRPPDNVEYFLSGIFDAQRRSGSMRPELFDSAFLAWRYRSEFGMEEIPAFVRRVIIPAVVAIGRATGKYRKFADAPEPVRRRRAV